MGSKFGSFVIFAGMRTGSNFLEGNLNAIDGLTCFGEAFNPGFVGYPNSSDTLGFTLAARNQRPRQLLRAIRAAPGMGGFRYFPDHDHRVLEHILNDVRCAKIILTRNPVDSYVSRKIAQTTGQWKLTNVTKRKDGCAWFDEKEFSNQLEQTQVFLTAIQHGLQTTGQTGFYIQYDDLNDTDVFNGLLRWLGLDVQVEKLNQKLKRQNPEPLWDKVANFDEMQRALAELDPFNLTRTTNHEPPRGPMVPSYIAAARAPLLYMPVNSGLEPAVTAWLAALDGMDLSELLRSFTQKSLRDWKMARPGHRSFTVVRHPLVRAHDVFCTRILPLGIMPQVRRVLQRVHAVQLPAQWPDPGYDRAAHYAGFSAFLGFLRANLAGQTALRVDGSWASQAQCLQGMANLTLPDIIIRERDMQDHLPLLAMQLGRLDVPEPGAAEQTGPFQLADIYDNALEARARDACSRDYVMFGFSDWSPD